MFVCKVRCLCEVCVCGCGWWGGCIRRLCEVFVCKVRCLCEVTE